MKIKHKETFYQPAEAGIPSHWVVQYYVDNDPFPHASYFETQVEADKFEIELEKPPESEETEGLGD